MTPQTNEAPRSTQPTNTPPSSTGSPWSIQIARVAGIPIRIHFTFLLLLVWLGYIEFQAGRSFVAEILFVLGLFFCVLLHELGHALTARRYGIRTRDIVLYPIGGVASVESLGKPNQEFWIAIAGPLVNVVIAILLAIGLTVTGIGIMGANPTIDDENVVRRLLVGNVLLALFNLIPAFPMDGGRILRALLASRIGHERGTRIAARVGQAFGILFVVAGLFLPGFLTLVIVGAFVFLAATGEGAVASQTGQSIVGGQKVRDAMITRFETLTHGQTLGDAADALLNTYQEDFPVLLGDRVLGVLPRDRLLTGLAREGRDAYVGEAMLREFPTAHADDDLEATLRHFMSNKTPMLIFDANERLVGLLTAENVGEFIMVRQSLAQSARR